MGLLENLWDDVVAGPQPDAGGRGHLRRISTGLNIKEGAKVTGSASLPGSPTTPATPGSAGRKVDVWRSVFHPASNLTTRDIGANVFDKPSPNSPTVYDWMYSGDSKSEHR